MKMNKVFSLCTDIQTFTGFNRTLVIDITRGNHHLISKKWSEIILKIDNCNKKELQEKITPEEKEIFHDVLSFLKKNNYIFEVDRNVKSQFKEINMTFETPFIFDLCFCEVSQANFKDIIEMINTHESYTFGGFHFLIYNLADEQLAEFKNRINSLELNKNIELYIASSKIDYFLADKSRNVSIHEASFSNNKEMKNHFYEKFPIMNIGMKQILESKDFNFFHNKTLFINENGNIVNSLFDQDPLIFRNIKECIKNKNSLNDLISDQRFTQYWQLDNSKIVVCKDCEFRRVCIDCRPPILNNNEWYKEECSYNPYLSQWKN